MIGVSSNLDPTKNTVPSTVPGQELTHLTTAEIREAVFARDRDPQ